jgi:asparagine synthase (glutamine-hydrolysing)
MCGINGFTAENKELVGRMNASTKHRGPDGSEIYTDADISFGFNRLAIIDLSQEAMQPMWSSDKRFVIIFNGEIYNYQELKKELAAYSFSTQSDTEVILAAYSQWGSAAFAKLNGMFALALWDTKEKRLVLARDPVGIKPLYYSFAAGKLVFSSEIKGILETGVSRKLNQEAFQHYLRLMYVPGDMTMIEGVHKVMPGHTLTYERGRIAHASFEDDHKAVAAPTSYKEGVALVKDTVTKAVERQLVSDRPIGVYLSGGIDSTTILAAASAVHPKINSYSVGFDLMDSEEKDKFNADSRLASETAKHFGATHHEYLLPSKEVASLFPSMVQYMDDPVGNATTLAQLYLAQKTKDTATVTLSGEGGDELFGGYERYLLALRASRYGTLVPKRLSKFLPGSLSSLHLKGVDRFAQLMFQKDAELNSILAKPIHAHTKSLFANGFTGGDIAEELMHTDEKNWLVDEALLRADTMNMGASVEGRVPLLDLEVRALAHSLPRAWKVTESKTKRILKDAFADVIPGFILTQPKRGWFSPGAKWLRRPEFVELADEIFQEGYTEASALFNIPHLRQVWQAHIQQKEYHYTVLWATLVFLAWAKEHNVTL